MGFGSVVLRTVVDQSVSFVRSVFQRRLLFSLWSIGMWRVVFTFKRTRPASSSVKSTTT